MHAVPGRCFLPLGGVLENFIWKLVFGRVFSSFPFKFQLLYISFLEVRVLVRVTELDFIVYVLYAAAAVKSLQSCPT